MIRLPLLFYKTLSAVSFPDSAAPLGFLTEFYITAPTGRTVSKVPASRVVRIHKSPGKNSRALNVRERKSAERGGEKSHW